jgi:hypothetical protein
MFTFRRAFPWRQGIFAFVLGWLLVSLFVAGGVGTSQAAVTTPITCMDGSGCGANMCAANCYQNAPCPATKCCCYRYGFNCICTAVVCPNMC